MHRAFKILLPILFVPLGLGGAIGVATFLAYSRNQEPCRTPLSTNELTGEGVAAPDGVEVCGREGATVQVVVRPSLLCLATQGLVSCPSMHDLALAFATRSDGWDTGAIDVDEKRDDANVALSRGSDRVIVRLHRQRFGDVTGTVDLFIAPAKSAKVADE
jgi:hypothetical protein